MKSKNNWDFFISHSSKDKKLARQFYSSLKIHSNVFFDEKSLAPGDEWDIEIKAALNKTKIILVLLSKNTKQSHFQREEIQIAINLVRGNKKGKKIIPIVIDDNIRDSNITPFGLALIHSITLNKKNTVDKISKDLIELLNDLFNNDLSKTPEVINSRPVEVHCPNCGQKNVVWKETLVFDKVKDTFGGLNIEGRYNMQLCGNNHCLNCGNIFDGIENNIPVDFKNRSCPTCKKQKKLKFRVTDYKRKEDHYKFKVLAYCGSCDWLRRTIKLFKNLFNTKKIEID